MLSISEAGYGHGLACYGLAISASILLDEIDSSESGCFGTDARATEVEPFSENVPLCSQRVSCTIPYITDLTAFPRRYRRRVRRGRGLHSSKGQA